LAAGQEEKMDVYEIVNAKIRESLEKGTVPWQTPWKQGELGLPRNFMTTKPYRGINTFMLAMTQQLGGYTSPFWITYKQAKELGGNVRQGEKSPSLVVFYKLMEKETVDENGENDTDRWAMLRYTPVFNTDQCEGLKVPSLIDETFTHDPIPAAEEIVANMPNRPALHIQRSNRAFYSPHSDSVTVPEMSQYPTCEQYYSTLFHELGHSTGHKSRLGREFGVSFADHTYSKEELVAEFTASYLCGIAGIEQRTVDNNASYIDHWLTILKDKTAKKWLVWAAANAQKAADYIRGINIESTKEAA
jgi:antirestriction protein ArdC